MWIVVTHLHGFHSGQRSAATVNTSTSLSVFFLLLLSLSLSLSDMLMLLILIGNRTEPSADKKTMLAAAHRFLPGALKGVLQTVSEFMGFSQSVVLQIVLTVSSGLCLTACFYQRGVYELNVCLCVCVMMIVSVCTYRWYSVHCLCCVYTSTISKVNSLFLLLTWVWPQDHWCVFALLTRMFTPAMQSGYRLYICWKLAGLFTVTPVSRSFKVLF